ncbi:MAG TPA: hypothetical protein VFK05_28370 [Polyangiaceae bacterium]|nr:hypothetical protein [Polyangiaceae bacterium]
MTAADFTATATEDLPSLSNLYRMLCYAWKRTDTSTLRAGETTSFQHVQDLLAFLLARATKDILRRGIARGYRELTEDLRVPKGKLLAGETMKRQLRPCGRAACTFDEWETDIPANRILKAALGQLGASLIATNPGAAHELRNLERHFSQVSSIPLTPSAFRRLIVEPGQRHYDFALEICAFLASSRLPSTEAAGRHSFVDPRTDEQHMGWIFESFVRCYLKLHLSAEHRVLPERRVEWSLNSASPVAQAVVPGMETDVRIATPRGLTVVEVKCPRDALAPSRDGKRRLRPAYLYQLHAYVSHLAQAALGVHRAVLLLGSPTRAFSHRYRMGSIDWLVTNIDLRGPWEDVAAGVLAVAGDAPEVPLN